MFIIIVIIVVVVVVVRIVSSSKVEFKLLFCCKILQTAKSKHGRAGGQFCQNTSFSQVAVFSLREENLAPPSAGADKWCEFD